MLVPFHSEMEVQMVEMVVHQGAGGYSLGHSGGGAGWFYW